MKTALMLFIFLGFPFQFIKSDDTKVIWTQDRKLTWNDFKGNSATVGRESAISWCGISYNWAIIKNTVRIVVKSHFDKQYSCVIMKDTSDNLLKHEQGHFDITEVYARKLRKKFLLGGIMKSNAYIQIPAFYGELAKDSVLAEQALYDGETNHSKDTLMQHKWNIRIANELKAYDQYSDTVVVFYVK